MIPPMAGRRDLLKRVLYSLALGKGEPICQTFVFPRQENNFFIFFIEKEKKNLTAFLSYAECFSLHFV
jgi:hypothetical protein